MKTFETLKKGDKILAEHVNIITPCHEIINGITYLSKIDVSDYVLEVISNPKTREGITDEIMKENNMHRVIYVTVFGTIDIPWQYCKSNICPNAKNGSTLKIIQ